MKDTSNSRFRNVHLLWLAAVLVAVSALAFGQSDSDPWLIVTAAGSGPLYLHKTHEDLVRTFGAANVVEQDGIDGMSGDMEYVTILFPKDPQRSIDIRWRDGDKKTVPESMTIRGGKSRWKTVHDISLGISLKKLEELNGRPFQLIGFGLDDDGTITSWESGSLAGDLDGGHGQVRIRLCPVIRKGVSETESNEVTGPGPFPSNHPVMQKLNPPACRLTWEFPSWEQKRTRN